MSSTNISTKNKTKLWLISGGRCEYPGCNKPLWKDSVTYNKMNIAYMAHIIADTPGGPRGDEALSEKLSDDISNLMLLCDVHHRLIDNKNERGEEPGEHHPVDLLRKFKNEHERRIELLTSLDAHRKSYIVSLTANIDQHKGFVNFRDAKQAMLPERFPASDQIIKIDLTSSTLTEEDPEYWTVNAKNITRQVNTRLQSGPDGKEINHISVFGFAPIPLLIHFGKELGNKLPTDLYQKHRDTENWSWKDLKNKEFKYELIKQPKNDAKTNDVVLILSLSGKIHVNEITDLLGENLNIYEMSIPNPDPLFLKALEQLELFSKEIRKLLAKIRQNRGEDCVIHLFPAVPIPIAIEIGRTLLPKADPEIYIYDKTTEGFKHRLTV